MREDHTFPALHESEQELPALFEEMRKIVLQDRDLHDKVSAGSEAGGGNSME